MGILADLFVSTDELATNYFESQIGEREAHLNRYHPIELRNLTDIEFSSLHALLRGEEWIYDRHGLVEVEVRNEGEAWLFKFPDIYIAALAKLNPPQKVHFAMQWAMTEELADWKILDTASTLSEMVGLAKQAVAKDKSLYLCGSL